MYVAKLPLDTSKAFEVIDIDNFESETRTSLEIEMPGSSKRKISYHLKKKVDRLFKDGYKEFLFSDKPETRAGEKAVLSFEEIDNKVYQRWTVEPDVDYYLTLINENKSKLAASDYKVIKCQEAQLAGKELPYDMEILSMERQSIRDEINRLEASIP